MKIYLLIFTMLLTSFSFGQSDNGSNRLSDGYKIRRGGAKGHPFLNDEWKVGFGVLENGEMTNPQLLNYDVHGDNLTYKTSPDAEIMVLQDDALVGFILKSGKENEEDLIFSKIEGSEFDKSKNENKYYQIAKAPSRSVIIEHKKELDDPNASGWTASSTNTKVPEYKLKTDVYVLNKNNKYEEVNLRKRSILRTFKDKKKELSNYIARTDLDVTQPAKLAELVDYYHSIPN